MKNQIIFKKGQKVTIARNGCNPSSFNSNQAWDFLGVYSVEDYFDKVFEIEGTVQLISFTFSPEVYGAYLLKYEGVNVGYVYNTGIKAIEK